MTNIIKLDYKGVEIRQDEITGLVCLTDMWRACGNDPKKQPNNWLRQENILELLVALMHSNSDSESELNLKPPYITDKVFKFAEQRQLIKTSAGRYGGTYAIPKLAIAYAKSFLQIRSPGRNAKALFYVPVERQRGNCECASLSSLV